MPLKFNETAPGVHTATYQHAKTGKHHCIAIVSSLDAWHLFIDGEVAARGLATLNAAVEEAERRMNRAVRSKVMVYAAGVLVLFSVVGAGAVAATKFLPGTPEIRGATTIPAPRLTPSRSTTLAAVQQAETKERPAAKPVSRTPSVKQDLRPVRSEKKRPRPAKPGITSGNRATVPRRFSAENSLFAPPVRPAEKVKVARIVIERAPDPPRKTSATVNRKPAGERKQMPLGQAASAPEAAGSSKSQPVGREIPDPFVARKAAKIAPKVKIVDDTAEGASKAGAPETKPPVDVAAFIEPPDASSPTAEPDVRSEAPQSAAHENGPEDYKPDTATQDNVSTEDEGTSENVAIMPELPTKAPARQRPIIRRASAGETVTDQDPAAFDENDSAAEARPVVAPSTERVLRKSPAKRLKPRRYMAKSRRRHTVKLRKRRPARHVRASRSRAAGYRTAMPAPRMVCFAHVCRWAR